MQPVDATARKYDPITMFFHWATAALVVTQWLGAQTIDWFPRGPLRVDARSVHITMGVLLAALLLGRVIWRLTGGRHLLLADKGALNLVAKGTHWGLYALLAAMVLAGVFLTWTRGDSIFPGRAGIASSTFSASRPTIPATTTCLTKCRRSMAPSVGSSWRLPACTPVRRWYTATCGTTACWAGCCPASEGPDLDGCDSAGTPADEVPLHVK